MGRLLLVLRLVAGDIKRRPVQSGLLLVVTVTTTATLTLGLTLRHVVESPFARTRAATRGPDVVAELQPNPRARGAAQAPFRPLLHARGVAAVAGPFPLSFVHLRAPGVDVPVIVEGRRAAPSAINRPLVTAGSWVRPGSAVVEQGLAGALGLHVGSAIALGGRTFRVGGIALETEQAFYPACVPGLVWMTPADATGLTTPRHPLGYEVDIKLDRSVSTTAFMNGAAVNAFGNETGNESALVQPWQQVRHDDYRIVNIDQKSLLIGSWLLAMLSLASIAVVVGGRMAEQTRRVGLLKAVGATPRMVAIVLLAENLALALLGAAIGLLSGWLLAPSIADPGTGLLGSPPAPPLTPASAGEVVLAALAVAGLATIVPAVRGARTSTLRALNDAARPPHRRPRLIALSARLPVPLLLALRLVARRVRRTALTAASLSIAVAMVVAALTLQHRIDLRQALNLEGAFQGSTVGGRVTHVIFILGAVLVVLAATTAIFTAWATVVDAERSTALARALGATPRQVGAGLAAAQLLPGLIAALIGIPAGLGLYELAGGRVATAPPPFLWLVAVVPATLVVIALLTAIPARLGARRPVAAVLSAE